MKAPKLLLALSVSIPVLVQGLPSEKQHGQSDLAHSAVDHLKNHHHHEREAATKPPKHRPTDRFFSHQYTKGGHDDPLEARGEPFNSQHRCSVC